MSQLFKTNCHIQSEITKNGFNEKNKHKVMRTKLCFVKDCKRNSKDNTELQFFCVSMAVQRRKKWFAIANAKYVSYHRRVWFLRSSIFRKLHVDAVPKISINILLTIYFCENLNDFLVGRGDEFCSFSFSQPGSQTFSFLWNRHLRLRSDIGFWWASRCSHAISYLETIHHCKENCTAFHLAALPSTSS
jgi:hypothetical protein